MCLALVLWLLVWGVVGVVVLTCVSSLLGSSGVTSALLTFLGLGLTDEAVIPGKRPATVAYCIKVTSTNEKSSRSQMDLGSSSAWRPISAETQSSLSYSQPNAW